MRNRLALVLAFVFLALSLSGCFYHTSQRFRQTGDNLKVLALDGETPTLWME